MAHWRDQELPPDETLRVLAGREPTWGFKVKRVLRSLMQLAIGAFVGLLILCAVIEFGWLRAMIILAVCLGSFVVGIRVGVRSRE